MISIRAVLESPAPSLGGWCAVPSPLVAECLGRCGLDWVCVDLQHGMIDEGELVPMLQALAGTQTPGLVRVGWNEPRQIMKALDAGAAGVVIPLVNSGAEAIAAAQSCRYPPAGIRSWGPARAALGVDEFSATFANARVACIVMAETSEAIDNLDEIVSAPGVDAIFVGANDLALSRGSQPGALSEAELKQQEDDLALILAKASSAGKPVAISCSTVEIALQRAAQGYRLLSLPSDMTLLLNSARRMVTGFRAGISPSA